MGYTQPMKSLSPPTVAAIRDLVLGKGSTRVIADTYGLTFKGLHRAYASPQGMAIRRKMELDIIDSYVRHLLALEYSPSPEGRKGKRKP